MRYRVQHITTYTYDDDVTGSYGQFHLRPRDLDWQRCLSHDVTVDPLDFGAVALVGSESGAVIMAGGVVWSGHGHYWVPSEWRAPDEIACGARAAAADATYLDPNMCPDEGKPQPPSAVDALDVALRSNLAAGFAAHGPFDAYVHLYTPSVGACDPGAAEYLVVLSQTRPE